MWLYAASSLEFIELTLKAKTITQLISTRFREQFGSLPSKSEKYSWNHSLPPIAQLLEENALFDNGVLVEYQLPLSPIRMDILLTGQDTDGHDNAVIIELKQWENCKLCRVKRNKVRIWLNGGEKEVLHPSVQAGNYKHYLERNCSAFNEKDHPIILYALSYLHNYNYKENDTLIHKQFKNPLGRFPLYFKGQNDALGEFLNRKLQAGNGMGLLETIKNSRYTPSLKPLYKATGNIRCKLRNTERFKDINHQKSNSESIPTDEQLVFPVKSLLF